MNEVVHISDIIEKYISGDWGSDTTSKDSPCQVSCIRGADIVPISNNEYGGIPTRYISSRSLSQKKLSFGDIVIEKSGGSPTQSTGRTTYISKELSLTKGDIVCSNFCSAFRVKDGWDSKYVYLYLQYIYNGGAFFNFEGKTSGLKNLDVEAAFKAITIKRIDIKQQRSIANVISKIEEKIALNRQINHNLDEQIRELYDYWFVQFDFPNEKGNPYKSFGGIMQWNEPLKRYLPKDWSNCTLSRYVGRITNGLNPRKNFVLGTGNNLYVTIKSLQGTEIDWENCDKCDDRALMKINARSQLQVGDIIFSAIGTIGRTFYIQEEPRNWNISETSFTIRSKTEINSEFLYLLLRSKEVQKLADKAAMGSTLRCLVMDSLKAVPCVDVPNQIIRLFSKNVSSILSRIYQNNKEIRNLRKIKTQLIPLLMSGQVSVN